MGSSGKVVALGAPPPPPSDWNRSADPAPLAKEWPSSGRARAPAGRGERRSARRRSAAYPRARRSAPRYAVLRAARSFSAPSTSSAIADCAFSSCDLVEAARGQHASAMTVRSPSRSCGGTDGARPARARAARARPAEHPHRGVSCAPLRPTGPMRSPAARAAPVGRQDGSGERVRVGGGDQRYSPGTGQVGAQPREPGAAYPIGSRSRYRSARGFRRRVAAMTDLTALAGRAALVTGPARHRTRHRRRVARGPGSPGQAAVARSWWTDPRAERRTVLAVGERGVGQPRAGSVDATMAAFGRLDIRQHTGSNRLRPARGRRPRRHPQDLRDQHRVPARRVRAARVPGVDDICNRSSTRVGRRAAPTADHPMVRPRRRSSGSPGAGLAAGPGDPRQRRGARRRGPSSRPRSTRGEDKVSAAYPMKRLDARGRAALVRVAVDEASWI